MRVIVIGLVVLAFSVAGISTYLIQNFSTPEAIGELEKKSRPIVNHVLVAKMDLVPGSVINGDAVVWREWPTDSMNDNYISVTDESEKDARFNQVADSRVRRTLSSGEPILSSKLFKSDLPGFMAGVVEKGMRAMAINVNPQTGVAGFILPGDHVDVLLVHQAAREAMQQINKNRAAQRQAGGAGAPVIEGPQLIEILRTATETILEDILVLAVDQTTGPVQGQAMTARTLLFELTPKQVQILTTAQTMGDLSVTLRNVGDVAVTEEPVAMPMEDASGSMELEGTESDESMDGNEGMNSDESMGANQTASGKTSTNNYTTDVEVSEFIRKLTKAAAGESQKMANSPTVTEGAPSETEAAQAKEIEALRQQLEASKHDTHSEPASEKAVYSIEIYRGGAAETEVIQFQ